MGASPGKEEINPGKTCIAVSDNSGKYPLGAAIKKLAVKAAIY